MNINRISVRYAKALFELALENNIAEPVYKDMQLISKVADFEDFRNMLENPVIFPSKKQGIFKLIFDGKIQDLSIRFFSLLTENKREIYLKAIARNFFGFYRKHFGIKSVELVTPFTAGEKLKKEVSTIIAKEFKTIVDLEDKTDEKLIGGFILTVEGMQYDASVASKLKDIKKELFGSPNL